MVFDAIPRLMAAKSNEDQANSKISYKHTLSQNSPHFVEQGLIMLLHSSKAHLRGGEMPKSRVLSMQQLVQHALIHFRRLHVKRRCR